MKIQKAELATKLGQMKSVIPKNPNNTALKGVLVKDGYLIASDLEMTIKTRLEGTEGELFLIPDRAVELINSLPDGELDLSVSDEYTLTIRADKIKNKYQTVDPYLFPTQGLDENINEFTFKAEQLLEAMRRVSYAIPRQGGNAIMTSLCLQAKDGQLNLVGSDGHVLAWDKMDCEGEFELLIPKNTIEKLKTLRLTGTVTIKHSHVAATFITEEFEIHTRILQGPYFRYKDMFQELPLHTVVSRKELLNATTRAGMGTAGTSPVRFEIKGRQLDLKAKDSMTDYQEAIELEEELEEELVIGFDSRLMIETLKAFDCENIGMSLKSPAMPLIIEAEDSDFKSIVLPIRIR